jgi:hypothetical protein
VTREEFIVIYSAFKDRTGSPSGPLSTVGAKQMTPEQIIRHAAEQSWDGLEDEVTGGPRYYGPSDERPLLAAILVDRANKKLVPVPAEGEATRVVTSKSVVQEHEAHGWTVKECEEVSDAGGESIRAVLIKRISQPV